MTLDYGERTTDCIYSWASYILVTITLRYRLARLRQGATSRNPTFSLLSIQAKDIGEADVASASIAMPLGCCPPAFVDGLNRLSEYRVELREGMLQLPAVPRVELRGSVPQGCRQPLMRPHLSRRTWARPVWTLYSGVT